MAVSLTHRPPFPSGEIPDTHFCEYQGSVMLTRPQGPIVAGSIKSMKNPSDSIGNQTRDFPGCSAVPPRTPPRRYYFTITAFVQFEKVGSWPTSRYFPALVHLGKPRSLIRHSAGLYPKTAHKHRRNQLTRSLNSFYRHVVTFVLGYIYSRGSQSLVLCERNVLTMRQVQHT